MSSTLLIFYFVAAVSDVNTAVAKEKRSWSLQTTSSVELSTQEWCEKVATGIQSNFKKVDTVLARAYCIPRDDPDKPSPATSNNRLSGAFNPFVLGESLYPKIIPELDPNKPSEDQQLPPPKVQPHGAVVKQPRSLDDIIQVAPK